MAVKVEVGGEYDARARLVCPEIASRSVKEVAINCGWINEARAGRIFNLKLANLLIALFSS
jgi:hypothetical protein